MENFICRGDCVTFVIPGFPASWGIDNPGLAGAARV